MKSLRNKNLGRLGEEIAAKFLQEKGYKIIERNFRKRYSEIDLVCLDHDTLVFVEVKTRIGNKFGIPEESVTPWKLRSLIRSAQYYKLLHPKLPESLRMDMVAVSFDGQDSVAKVNWYKNITL